MFVRRALAWGGLAPVFLACSLVTRFDGLVPLGSDASVVNPSPEAGPDGALASTDGSTARLSLAAACSQFFSSYVVPCTLTGVPASDLAPLQARWVTSCTTAFALDGSRATASSLSQCAAAYVGWDCFNFLMPSACVAAFAGSRMGGASCSVSSQCQSASCDLALADAAVSAGCGTCDTPIDDGQPCGTEATAVCLPDEVCTFPADTCGRSDGGPPPATIPMGAACSFDASAPECDLGLYCGTEGTCVPNTFAGAGQPCDGIGRLCLVGYCGGGSVTEADGGSGLSQGTCPMVIADGQPCDPSSAAAACDLFAFCFDGRCVLDYSDSLCP